MRNKLSWVGGWVAGWMAGLIENKANLVLKLGLENKMRMQERLATDYRAKSIFCLCETISTTVPPSGQCL